MTKYSHEENAAAAIASFKMQIQQNTEICLQNNSSKTFMELK